MRFIKCLLILLIVGSAAHAQEQNHNIRSSVQQGANDLRHK